ncbi:Hypothetical protein NTJ_09569 [Nesidiocoris tenuis]|uniref:Orcokinin n=1 Tax=Nesidiocoris tenuis TaxID=355587 RepID=A0ABN7AX36_9HEMI|nr:Hypothetical protein NTJ_09569 [Nesidiocoris tenuis]
MLTLAVLAVAVVSTSALPTPGVQRGGYDEYNLAKYYDRLARQGNGRQYVRNLDPLAGDSFGTSKRFDSLDNNAYGAEKRNWDEIDRAGFRSFQKKNFDEIDRAGFTSFVKRPMDEIDRAGFTRFQKRPMDEIDRAGFTRFVKRPMDEIDRAGFDHFVKRETAQNTNGDEQSSAGAHH